MLNIRAGRGELAPSVEGGWTEDAKAETKRWGAGEDFFAFSLDNGSGGYTHMALSDGVGGWADQTDPSLFSQALMYYYARSAGKSPVSAPWELLESAYEGVKGEEGVPMGSATAVGVGLGDTGELRGVK